MTTHSDMVYALGGVPVLGDFPFTTGSVFFVHNSTGSDNANQNQGKVPSKPYKTLDYAVGKCTASKGDVIVLMPGHAENIIAAAGANFDVAGVTVIGIGKGADMPKLTFTTATTADIDIGAASITIKNVKFSCGVLNLTAPIDVNAADFTMQDCITMNNDSTMYCDDWIVIDGNADRTSVLNHTHVGNTGGAVTAGGISLCRIRGGPENVRITLKEVDSNFSTAVVNNDSTALDSLYVYGSTPSAYVRNRHATGIIATAQTTTKGHYGPNLNIRSVSNDAGSIMVGADMEFFAPISIVNDDGERSMEYSGTQSTS